LNGFFFKDVAFCCDPKTGKQQTVKSPNEHGNTLGNQPAERYKLVDKKTGKPLKSGETTHEVFFDWNV
jgi:hypothetical protein